MRSSMVFPPPRRLGGHGAEAHSGLSDDGCSAATCGRARPFEALGSATQIPLDVEQHSLPEPFSFAALGARAEPVDSSTPTPATGCDFKIMSAVAVHTEMCTCWAQGVPTGPRVPAPASASSAASAWDWRASPALLRLVWRPSGGISHCRQRRHQPLQAQRCEGLAEWVPTVT